MSKIFINYRRDDSAAYAGRLYDRLASHFGRDHIFMDIDQIGPGEDFLEVIQEKLSSVQIAVVMIGKHWLDITDDSGQRRLDNPDDFVRVEIAALLERKIRVIPVLVGGASVPKSSQLPECLMPLVRRHAHEISNHRFHSDVDKLIQALEKIIGAQMPSRSTEPPKIPNLQISASASQDNFSKQANTDNTVAKQPDRPNPHRLSIILGTIVIFIAAISVFNYFPRPVEERAVEEANTNSVQSAISQPDVFSTTQLVAEQPSELLLRNQSESEQPSASRLSFEPEMVRIPPGKFLMGSDDGDSDEQPVHEVTIAYAFEISKFEVTFDEYDHFAQTTGRDLPRDGDWGRGCRPVINISFDDAQAYVLWLSDQTGKKYRLPTEAEWEYAARAGTQDAYWWGNDIGENNAVCGECGSRWDFDQTAPVGSFKPNQFDLHDTAGNVWEWVDDCWHGNYQGAPTDGSAWKEANSGDCNRRVNRGGSWINDPRNLRSAIRFGDSTDFTSAQLGFRIARDL